MWPPSSLTKLMKAILETEKMYHTKIPATGHSIDKNLHPTPLKELADRKLLEVVNEDLCQQTIKLAYLPGHSARITSCR